MDWSSLEGFLHGRSDQAALSAVVDRPGLRAYLSDVVRSGSTPGIAVGVVEGQAPGRPEVLSFGVRDARGDAPFDETVATRWFSVTKMVTATCLMALAERGVVDLDEPVHQRWRALAAPSGGRAPVTARDLLAHTSGLSHPLPVGWVRSIEQPPVELETFVARQLRGQRPSGGSPTRYTNLGYLVLECWVQQVTGRAFASVLREVVLDPLGMTHTTFSPLGADVAAGHQRRGAGAWLLRAAIPRSSRYIAGVTEDFYVLHPFVPVGSAYGGLVGPLGDLLRLLGMFVGLGRSPEGAQVLSERSVREMTTVWGRGNGEMGLGCWRDGGHWVHEGAAVGSRAAVRLDLEARRAVAVLAPVTSFDVDGLGRVALATLRAGDVRSTAASC